MRVICERIESATTGEELESSPWLTLGAEYLVLEILVEPTGRMLLRLADDGNGGPGVWDARLFRSSSDAVPSSWSARLDMGGRLTLGPRAWQRDGFWEGYFDGDPEAVEEFEKAKRVLVSEDEALHDR